MEVGDVARQVSLAAVNDMHNDDDPSGIVTQQVADHPIVADAQLPEAGQILSVGYQALFGIIEIGQAPKCLADTLLDRVVEPAKLIAGSGVPLNPGRQYSAPSRA